MASVWAKLDLNHLVISYVVLSHRNVTAGKEVGQGMLFNLYHEKINLYIFHHCHLLCLCHDH